VTKLLSLQALCLQLMRRSLLFLDWKVLLYLLLGWACVIALLLWLRHGRSRKVAPFAIICMSAALLYIPGAPYFFMLLAVLFYKKSYVSSKVIKKPVLYLGILSSLLVLSTLCLSMVRDVDVLKAWLLLPESIDWSSIPRNILRVPSAFIYRAPGRTVH
jgi:hypothetical protein